MGDLLTAAKRVVKIMDPDAEWTDPTEAIADLDEAVKAAEMMPRPLYAMDNEIGDAWIVKCDIEGTVYSRDEEARAMLKKVLAALEAKDG